jgi:exopolysaccharide biosynthesis polyprenyl glycosylphosphotransferase
MARPPLFVSPRDLSAATRRAPLQSAGATQQRRVGVRHDGWFQVIGQDLFGDALLRECRRSDRFEQPFALVLLTLDEGSEQEQFWNQVIAALAETAFDTDIVGWFRQGSTLGLIRPLPLAAHHDSDSAIAAKVRRDLAVHLGEELNRCSVRCELYSPITAPAPLLEPPPPPRYRVRNAAKRLLDIVGSAALLLVFSPVFLLVTALVKLTSRGPVLFPQERIGANGQPFTMMKFRTMHVNADPRIHQQYVENFIQSKDAPASNERVFKIVNDPRITPLGHILRRSSLDELPQFWNVLKGEMSLVGPRPPLPYEVARYKSWHRRRVFEAKPGLTGLWQVTGRSRTTFDEMVRLDLRYARNYSVWTDLKIIMATPKAMISGKGAH